MKLGRLDRLFVLTGAGISAESGLATFRGSGGLWNGHRVEEVATPEAWHANPELVWHFYSMRRRDALAAQPNQGHLALAKVEQTMGDRFYLCTQNVDDLHERAGSRRVHHMHGTLFQSRCIRCQIPFDDRAFYETATADLQEPTSPSPARATENNSERIYGRHAPVGLPRCQKCGQLIRPHIVWFGEIPLDMPGIYEHLDQATQLIVIGTSGSVYPAAGLVHIANQRGIKTIYVGPEEPLNADAFEDIILGAAASTLPELFENVL